MKRKGFLQIFMGSFLLLGEKEGSATSVREQRKATLLGYVDNTGVVNQSIFKNHENNQMCAVCRYYYEEQGVSKCLVLTGIQINKNGWCTSFEKI